MEKKQKKKTKEIYISESGWLTIFQMAKQKIIIDFDFLIFFFAHFVLVYCFRQQILLKVIWNNIEFKIGLIM